MIKANTEVKSAGCGGLLARIRHFLIGYIKKFSREVGNGDHKADALHIGEGRSFSTAIEDIIDYVENPEKTDYGKLIYGFECDTPAQRMRIYLSQAAVYQSHWQSPGADDVIAYHFRQAFKPGEVTPEEANQIGQELAMRLTKGNNAFIVCTP